MRHYLFDYSVFSLLFCLMMLISCQPTNRVQRSASVSTLNLPKDIRYIASRTHNGVSVHIFASEQKDINYFRRLGFDVVLGPIDKAGSDNYPSSVHFIDFTTFDAYRQNAEVVVRFEGKSARIEDNSPSIHYTQPKDHTVSVETRGTLSGNVRSNGNNVQIEGDYQSKTELKYTEPGYVMVTPQNRVSRYNHFTLFYLVKKRHKITTDAKLLNYPRKNAKLVAKIPAYSEFTIISIEKEYMKVGFNGQIGYVYRKNLIRHNIFSNLEYKKKN